MKADVTMLYDAKGRLRARPVVLAGVELDLDTGGNALVFGERHQPAKLHHAVVAFISKDGLLIRGFEEIAADRFIRQEWWVRPCASATALPAP